MKILMIAPQPFYLERGTPMNVRLLCQVLGEAGHAVDLLVFPTGKPITLPKVRILALPNLFRTKSIPAGFSLTKLAYDALLTPAAFLRCLLGRYDVVHGIEEGGFLAVGLGKLFGKPAIWDMDSCISDQLSYGKITANKGLLSLVSFCEKKALASSSLVITVCAALSRKARELAPNANVVQIEDIPLMETRDSEEQPGLRPKLVAEYGLSGCELIVYTGNLQSYQGIELLLEAWRHCQASGTVKPRKLVVVGGPKERVAFYSRRAEELGIQDSICWTGPRPVEEMQAWMSMSRVLVSPRSEGENTPLKIYTYMAAGRPIVATKKTTHTQVLDSDTAFLAAPEPVKFGELLREALENPALARRKAERAQETVERCYSYPVFRDKLLAAYEELAGCLTERRSSMEV